MRARGSFLRHPVRFGAVLAAVSFAAITACDQPGTTGGDGGVGGGYTTGGIGGVGGGGGYTTGGFGGNGDVSVSDVSVSVTTGYPVTTTGYGPTTVSVVSTTTGYGTTTSGLGYHVVPYEERCYPFDGASTNVATSGTGFGSSVASSGTGFGTATSGSISATTGGWNPGCPTPPYAPASWDLFGHVVATPYGNEMLIAVGPTPDSTYAQCCYEFEYFAPN